MTDKLSIRLRNSRSFAELWHKCPRLPDKPRGDRYGDYPYTFHLDQVLSIALEFGETDDDVLVATRVHDLIEDVPAVSRNMIADICGHEVAQLAWCMTKPDGVSRKKGASTYYEKLLSGGSRALRLKLYDRIANVRSCWSEIQRMDENKRNRSKLGMYKSEYGAFRKTLHSESANEVESALWNELDRLLAWQE